MISYIGAVDQGTTSTRFSIFDKTGRIVAWDQKEHRQIFPKPGWVEHDPEEIWRNTQDVIKGALAKGGIGGENIIAIGITNQRETTVVWDKRTGKPFCNAIVWQCTRTREICQKLIADGGTDRFREITGLPVATYFSGPKISWLLDHIPEARKAAIEGHALFGTMDSWIIWQLTGGPNGGAHVTDVTNASRTLLMDLKNLSWDHQMLAVLNIPHQMLPKIVPSSDQNYWGLTDTAGPLSAAIPVCAALGDQQAALVGQTCFSPGEAKSTFGTGAFLLMNTGEFPIVSRHGLITTVAYQLGSEKPCYCLEGSISISGALVQWMRDNLGLISTSAEIEDMARTVDDCGGIYFVPAFSGLFAPYWRSDARGVIAGLTHNANKGHLARAVLEATAYQIRDIVEAMEKDSGVKLTQLKVDGGMTANALLMQIQADILNVPVIRPAVTETTVLGAAYAAGLAAGFWAGKNELCRYWSVDRIWDSKMAESERQSGYLQWKKAVSRTLDWLV